MYEYGFPSFKNSGTKVYVCFDGRQNFQSQFQCNCLRDTPLTQQLSLAQRMCRGCETVEHPPDV